MPQPTFCRNIVVAIEDDHSLEVIKEWLKRFSSPASKYFVINVMEPAEAVEKWPSRQYRTDAEALIKRCEDVFKSEFPDSQVECVLKEGYAENEIVQLATDCAADCVVVAGRGLGKIGRFLFGSVSSAVVAQSPCTVIVLKRMFVDKRSDAKKLALPSHA